MNGNNGVAALQKYLGVALAILGILALLSGVVYAWSDTYYRSCDNARRIERIERVMETQNEKLDLILAEVRTERD